MTSEHNNTYYQTSEQRPIRNEFDSKRIVKRDFWLIPTYLVMNIVFPLILTFIVMAMISGITGGHISESKFTKYYLGYAQVFTLIGQCLVLVVFYLMHRKTIIPIAISRFKALKKHIPLIIIVMVALYVLQGVYGYLVEFLPKQYQFDDTENNKMIIKMFEINWLWPVLFLDIVIITPVVEELLFRHLLIHELGKKLTYGVMYVVSVLGFAGLHMTSASSPFEVGPYIIMATGFVVAYHLSGRNLAMTITLHMINNFVSFIAIIMSIIWG